MYKGYLSKKCGWMKYKGYLTDSPSMRVSKQIETNLAITNPEIKWLE